MSETEIAQRIQSALQKARSAWRETDHAEDAALRAQAELRERLQSQFTMSRAVLVNFHGFFSPSLGKFFARSVSRLPHECRTAARGSPALPPDALYIGTCDETTKFSQFLEDIRDALACANHCPA